MHTTNYYNTFIEVAEDCPVVSAEVPPQKGDAKTVAGIQFNLVYVHPYAYSSDDVLFKAYAEKNKIPGDQLAVEREKFFSKGQPCFRASPLTKRYGWGLHSNADGMVALHAMESDEYRKLQQDASVKHLKAMRSKKG